MAQFKQGQSGNPLGRPRGAKSRSTRLRNLLANHADQLTNKLIEMALGGDIQAMRLCIERLIPRSKAEPINLAMEEFNLNSIESLLELSETVIELTTSGELSVEQSQQLSQLIDSHCKTIQTHQLSQRLADLENILKIRSIDHEKD